VRLLEELLEDQRAKALLVLARASHEACLAPFIGPARLHESLLIWPRDRPPRLAYLSPLERDEAAASGIRPLSPEELDVARAVQEGYDPVELWSHVVARAAERAGVTPGRVALAGGLDAGLAVAVCDRLAADGWSFVPGAGIVERLAKRKDAATVGAVCRVAAGAGDALRRVAALLAAAHAGDGVLELGGEALTVGRLRREIALVLAHHRLEQPEGNIVAPAEEGAVPHTSGSDPRPLRPGESLIVDLFPRRRLFADVTRTFCVGPPSDELAAAHAAVRRALERARADARPGVRGWQLQETVCELFAERGYETPISHPGSERGYVHGLGHGVGWRVHEYPSFRRKSGDEGRLEAGDVFTLEPGLYHPEAGWAVRLEDLHALNDDGLELLTPLPYDLDPRAWRQL